MATFIKCSCEDAVYKGYAMHNSPINIDLVTQVLKFNERYYPDNEGTPAIKFAGINVDWIYGKNQLKERDADYEKIVNNSWQK